MSKHIVIGKCRKCGAIVGKVEEGEIDNFNGIKAVNTEIFQVSSCFCKNCNRKKVEVTHE